MAQNDYYATLGVSRTSTAEEIRKAHKKLSRKYHPDVNKEAGASEKFKEVQEAFEVLGDKDKRQQYDQFGTAFPGGAAGGPRGQTYTWTGAGPGGGGPVDLGDLFGGQVDLESLLGGAFGGGGFPGAKGGARRRGRAAGENFETEVEVPFQIAVEGGKYELSLQRDGKIERLTVKIPAGVDNGSVVRLSGQGHPGMGGGPAGDLLVRIRVAPHPYFRREGNDLLVDVPITVTEAALGAKVEVPTLQEGTVMLTIPPGTSSGAKLRLRGEGVPDVSTKKHGDQYVVVKIVAPQNLNERARELLKDLADAAPQAPRKGLW
jgi:DnaJ-class molecular chaperone